MIAALLILAVAFAVLAFCFVVVTMACADATAENAELRARLAKATQ